MTSDGALSERFIADMREEFPGFRIVDKREGLLSQVIHWVLLVLTFGGQREYLSHYHTVLGNTLYVPASWPKATDIDRVILLRHERVHLRQRRRYGFVGLSFLYLIPFFPLGLAYGRARLEWEAYEETIRATAEPAGIEAAASPELRRRIVSRFVGGAYGWMWPFPRQINAWYDRVLAELTSGMPACAISRR